MKLPAMLAGTTAGLLLAGFAVAQGPATRRRSLRRLSRGRRPCWVATR
jgi:hypothetical protein